MNTIYTVKSTNLTVLKRTELVEKGEPEIWKNTPDAWKQGEYTNVVVSKGMTLSTTEYEPTRLHVLYTNGMLELVEGESVPSEEYRVADKELLDEAMNSTDKPARVAKGKGKGKQSEEDEAAK